MKSRLLLAMVLTSAWACSAHAHGFEERYDLPVPLGYIVAGACAVVLLTFVLAVLFVRQPLMPRIQPAGHGADQPQSNALRWAIGLVRSLSWLLFVVTIVSALWGSADPLMNLAPTLVWIIWWIGLAFAVVLLGNFWPILDPWRSTFDAIDFCVRKLGYRRGLSARWAWPVCVGVWPAAFLLLGWCWLEVVYPIASSPLRLGYAAMVWSAVSLAGMACFGRDVWQKHGDVFAIYFATLGRLSPVRFMRQEPAPASVAGQTGFVMAMLSTVLFDGLHGGVAWTVFEQLLRKIAPQWMDVNGYFAGTVGLLVVWLVFVAAYLAICSWTARLMLPATGSKSGWQFAGRFAITLVPIAAAYNLAHNFSSLLIQGQRVFQLLSDPLGRQWDLFGTARFYPDITVVDARLTWFVAVGAIVVGHAVSIWLAHRLALGLMLSPWRTALAMTPLTCLMLAYTAVSLVVIAEPMVVYSPAP